MDRRLRQITCNLVVIAALFFTSLAYAQSFSERFWKKDQKGQETVGTMVKELKLSPKQEQQITEQRNKQRQQAEELGQRLKACRDELSRELNKDAPDKSKVHALVAEMKEIMGKRIEQRVERILLLKEILTPEQFKQLNEKTRGFEWQKGRSHEKDSHSSAYYRRYSCRYKYQ